MTDRWVDLRDQLRAGVVVEPSITAALLAERDALVSALRHLREGLEGGAATATRRAIDTPDPKSRARLHGRASGFTMAIACLDEVAAEAAADLSEGAP